MKTDDQIDLIMADIPERWRWNWCGGERGACACVGCVQIGNRAVIAKRAGKPYRGDPEYIDERKLQALGAVYEDNKISREEWESWKRRTPNENEAR